MEWRILIRCSVMCNGILNSNIVNTISHSTIQCHKYEYSMCMTWRRGTWLIVGTVPSPYHGVVAWSVCMWIQMRLKECQKWYMQFKYCEVECCCGNFLSSPFNSMNREYFIPETAEGTSRHQQEGPRDCESECCAEGTMSVTLLNSQCALNCWNGIQIVLRRTILRAT